MSANPMKPPNILVFGDQALGWKRRIERVVNTKLYLVYASTQAELESELWVENCRLLFLSDLSCDQCSGALRRNLAQFVSIAGSIVVKGSASVDGVDLSKAERLRADADADVNAEAEADVDAEIQRALERLGVSCTHESNTVSKTQGYLISDKRAESFFVGDQPQEEFRISDEAVPADDGGELAFTPVRLARPDKRKFNTEEYFQFLRTRQIGRTLLYTENVSTTMVSVRTIDSVHGAVAVASRQITPMARGRNSWISPPGCAMFSLALHIDRRQRIAERLSFLQHIAALSILRAIRSVHPSLEVGIKWPNDVYFKREAKLGGILSTCTATNSGFTCYIGCGVNVSNSEPLTCINALARSTELTVERLIASSLSELEQLLDLFERDAQTVLDQYHVNWLHSGETVFVEAVGERAVVQGVDAHGFLLAEKSDGERIRLQPDGNSFDLMRGLIHTK